MMEYENMITVKELAGMLGITHDGALKLVKQLGIGEKRAGIWWFGESDVVIAKHNCQKYLLAKYRRIANR